MNLPTEVAAEITSVVGSITSAEPVSGGCISSAARIRAGDREFFLKWATRDVAGRMFECEARALGKIAQSNTVPTPEVIAVSARWLLLQWLNPAKAQAVEWRNFGCNLAQLHEVSDSSFGWIEPNYIGSLTQSNTTMPSWSAFWREQRLRPQLERASRAGAFNRADLDAFERLFAGLDVTLEVGQREGASLLHGDLWSGNVHAHSGGIAVIDPSSYFGHREVDLAMADLFGGFPPQFRDGYEEAWPLQGEGLEARRAAYQLYYLLVHVNLFGGAYVQQTRGALARALRP